MKAGVKYESTLMLAARDSGERTEEMGTGDPESSRTLALGRRMK